MLTFLSIFDSDSHVVAEVIYIHSNTLAIRHCVLWCRQYLTKTVLSTYLLKGISMVICMYLYLYIEQMQSKYTEIPANACQ